MKKILIGTILFSLLIFVGHTLFIKPILNNINNCYQNELQYQNENFPVAAKIIDKEEQKQYVCSTSEESILNLKSCLNTISVDSLLGGIALNYLPIANAKKNINQNILEHNNACLNQIVLVDTF